MPVLLTTTKKNNLNYTILLDRGEYFPLSFQRQLAVPVGTMCARLLQTETVFRLSYLLPPALVDVSLVSNQ